MRSCCCDRGRSSRSGGTARARRIRGSIRMAGRGEHHGAAGAPFLPRAGGSAPAREELHFAFVEPASPARVIGGGSLYAIDAARTCVRRLLGPARGARARNRHSRRAPARAPRVREARDRALELTCGPDNEASHASPSTAASRAKECCAATSLPRRPARHSDVQPARGRAAHAVRRAAGVTRRQQPPERCSASRD